MGALRFMPCHPIARHVYGDRRISVQRIAIPILLFTWLLLSVSPTHAQEAPVPDVPTPPRLSLAEGQVSFWRPGGENWTPARINTALAAGDSIYTGPGGNAEFQVGERAYARIGESTQLQLSSIEPDFVQLKLTAGEASVDLRQLAPGHTVEVDTPNAAYTIVASDERQVVAAVR
jgi:hypothetical protein